MPHIRLPTSLRARFFIPHTGVSVNPIRTLLTGAIALGLVACQNQPAQPEAAKPDAASADQFVADINAKLKKDYPEITAAQWLSMTYINPDSQLIAAKSNEKFLGELKANVDKATRFNGVELKPETRRALDLLKLSTAMPAPAASTSRSHGRQCAPSVVPP